MRLPTIALLVLAAAVFGCLMASREMVDSIGARALIAGIAFGGLTAVVFWILGRKVKN